MTYATFEDVEVRYFRPLESELRALVETRLKDAENRIRSRVKDLDQRIIDNAYYQDIIVQVCADAVIRLIRNPEGYVQESNGDYTYMLSQALADGRLTILPEEWQDLGVRKRVGVVHVIPQLPDSLRPDEFR